jgi:hypothetical protein
MYVLLIEGVLTRVRIFIAISEAPYAPFIWTLVVWLISEMEYGRHGYQSNTVVFYRFVVV